MFGIKRPGGSALNSTQVSSYRAAECICGRRDPAPELTDGIIRQAGEVLSAAGAIAEGGMGTEEVLAKRAEDAKLHDGCAAFIRNGEAIEDLLIRTKAETDRFWEENRAADYRAFEQLYINYDVLLTRYAMLSAIKSYIADGGLSRGSYLIGTGEIPEKLETDTKHFGSVLVTSLSNGKDGISSSSSFVPVRPVPKVDNTFENVYNAFGRKNRV